MNFRKYQKVIIVIWLISVSLSFSVVQTKAEETIYSYEIINSYPHDPQAFTQGLVYYEGYLYESTGLYGQSSLRKVNLLDGKIKQKKDLVPTVFGEGITIFADQIIQLTWREQLGYVYDLTTFDLLKTFHYSTEGWGLTNDGEYLIMSDGSSTLTYLTPDTFEPVHQLEVKSARGPIEFLNELEYIDGEIYANIWLTDYIARINPADGRVIGWIDLSGLLDLEQYSVDVLNGIAYDNIQQRLFVTGKFWPRIYEVELIPRS